MPNLADVLQSIRPSLLFTTSRVLVYILLSFVAVSLVVTNAFMNHTNFYSVAVHLSQSSRSALILANFAGVLTFLAGKVLQHVFFGSLRPLEVERLYDRLWFFLSESLLAFTIFRDEFDVAFGAMFGLLLFIKCFHWLMSDRVESMDQIPYPGPNFLFHARFLALFGILAGTDLILLAFAAESIIIHGMGGIVLFGSEYAILLASTCNFLAKYFVYAYDQRRTRLLGGENAPAWENKSRSIFYIELVTDFVKLITYLAFFLLVLAFYGLPLNIVRDVFMTGRSFYHRVRDLVRYRAATKNMNERYPNASEAELSAMSDKTCIICRDEMTFGTDERENTDTGPNVTPKKLPCGHIFHFQCLRSWLERQQSCPTCRRGVFETPVSNGTVPEGTMAQNPQREPMNEQGVPEPVLNGGMNQLFNPPVPDTPRVAPGSVAQSSNPREDGSRHSRTTASSISSQRQAQQVLSPPPRFQGFVGPDGIWQDWDPEKMVPRIPSQTDLESPGNLDQSSENDESAERTRVITSEENQKTIREAAAQAALRRFENNLTNTSHIMDGVGAGEASDEGSSRPLTQEQAGPSSNKTTHNNSWNPPLIPMFDPSVFRPTLQPTRSLHHSLPPLLSAEQLSKLDSFTREAIDERLKILDGVQNALWRSAEELLRLKSVLPAPQASAVQMQIQTDERGKGKDEGVTILRNQ